MNLQELIAFHKNNPTCDESLLNLHHEAVELLTTLLPPKKSADIETLPDIKWNAHAVLHDALNVIPMGAPTMVIWIDKEENVRHRACCTNMEGVWLLHQQLNKYS